MIVLDEQLLRRDLAAAIRRWYRGTVSDIRQLRPATFIPDEHVPTLLRTVHQPLFATINVSDFWRRLAPDPQFTIACFDLESDQVFKIPPLLRRLLSTDQFRTRRKRLGKIARVSAAGVQYYTVDSWAIQQMEWPRRRRR